MSIGFVTASDDSSSRVPGTLSRGAAQIEAIVQHLAKISGLANPASSKRDVEERDNLAQLLREHDVGFGSTHPTANDPALSHATARNPRIALYLDVASAGISEPAQHHNVRLSWYA
jgi:putative NADH-flavin reductase